MTHATVRGADQLPAHLPALIGWLMKSPGACSGGPAWARGGLHPYRQSPHPQCRVLPADLSPPCAQRGTSLWAGPTPQGRCHPARRATLWTGAGQGRTQSYGRGVAAWRRLFAEACDCDGDGDSSGCCSLSGDQSGDGIEWRMPLGLAGWCTWSPWWEGAPPPLSLHWPRSNLCTLASRGSHGPGK